MPGEKRGTESFFLLEANIDIEKAWRSKTKLLGHCGTNLQRIETNQKSELAFTKEVDIQSRY